MYTYARKLGAFYDGILAFQHAVEGIEQSVAREGGHPEAPHRRALGWAVQSLMREAEGVEEELRGADALMAETRGRFRRLTGSIFGRSRTLERALAKPRGYAGDHAVLDLIYTRTRPERGLDRVLEELAQETPASAAVRARKEYVVRWLGGRLARSPGATVVDLACGPCRVERDLFDRDETFGARFVAADHDPEALAYGRRVLGPYAPAVHLAEENAIHIARQRALPASFAGARYLVSLGLFDYLSRRLSVGLLQAIRRGLAPGSEILVGNFAKGNPSQTFMEWTTDWTLLYRDEDAFRAMFVDAGFAEEDLVLERETPHGGLVLMMTATVR